MSCCGNKAKKEPLLPVPIIESEEVFNEFLNLFERLKENPTITENKAHEIHSLFSRIYQKTTAFNPISVDLAIRNLKNAYAYRDNLLKKAPETPIISEKYTQITFILNERPYKYELKEGVYHHLEGGFTRNFKKILTIEEVEALKTDSRIEIIQ